MFIVLCRKYSNVIYTFLQSDFFAIEILNGHVYVHLDLGSGNLKVRASRRRVDDAAWHELVLRRTGKDGRVTVDGSPAEFITSGKKITRV